VLQTLKNPFQALPRLFLLCVALALTGCYKHTRIVQQISTPDVVMNATADDLVRRLNANFDAIQTLNAGVTLTASTGGGHAGKVTEYTAFKGYILIRKPRDLRVILQVPVFGGVGMDMVSNGKDFKLIIPHENKAMVGTDEVKTPSPKPLENLRPHVFFDAFLVPSVTSAESVALTQSERILTTDVHKNKAIEEPDYDLAVLRKPTGSSSGNASSNILETARVVHYSRVTLLPYQQDIYDEKGRIVTSVLYDHYQRFGDLDFPMSIDIRRPYDEYELKVVVTKLTANKPLDDDQFQVEIPPGTTIQQMN